MSLAAERGEIDQNKYKYIVDNCFSISTGGGGDGTECVQQWAYEAFAYAQLCLGR